MSGLTRADVVEVVREFLGSGYHPGAHNVDLEAQQARLLRAETFRDLSTLHISVTRGVLPVEVVQCREALMPEMNQRRGTLIVSGHTCADGYNAAVTHMLENERRDGRPWRYVLFSEDDVLFPPDGLRRLLRAQREHPEFAGISGLCWTRTPEGQPMILGDPRDTEREYYPQVPLAGGLQEARSIPLGFTLVEAGVFRDPRFPAPWFREDCGVEGEPEATTSVDVYLWHQLRKRGYRCAVLTDLKLGHRDPASGVVY